MPKRTPPAKDGRLPPQVLMLMPDKALAEMKALVRHKMRIGHPVMPKEEWDQLCNLECQLRLEAVNRHFLGTRVKSLKYGK